MARSGTRAGKVILLQLIQRPYVLFLLILLLELTTSASAANRIRAGNTVFTLAGLNWFQASASNSSKIMKLTVRRYGGYAGTKEVLVVLDTKSLSAEKESALREVLEHMQRLFPLDPSVGADFMHYEILIEEGGAQHTLKFTDDSSDKARQLVELTNQIVAMGL
jgi:hypothetical protein